MADLVIAPDDWGAVMVTRRHPVRAFFGGLLLGLGIALVLVFAGVPPVGEWSVVVLLVVGIVIGLLVAYLAPPRSTTTAAPTTPSEPATPA